MMLRDKTLIGVALLITLAPCHAGAANNPTGIWLDQSGRGAVEITQCGDSICGHVVWVKDSGDSGGCGLQIIGSAKRTGEGVWDDGWIYSPEDDKKYDVELKTIDENKLRVKGYMGTKLFSETMIWKRAPSDIARCDGAHSSEVKGSSVSNISGAVPAKLSPSVPAVTDAEAVSTAPEGPVTVSKGGERPTAELPNTAKGALQENEEGSKVAAPKGQDTKDSTGSEISVWDGFSLTRMTSGQCAVKLPFAKIEFDCPE
jgi:uncharacterized protein (DUF2147 family)